MNFKRESMNENEHEVDDFGGHFFFWLRNPKAIAMDSIVWRKRTKLEDSDIDPGDNFGTEGRERGWLPCAWHFAGPSAEAGNWWEFGSASFGKNLPATMLWGNYRVRTDSPTKTVLIPLPAPPPPLALELPPIQSEHPTPLLGSGLGIWPCWPLFTQSSSISW